MNGNGQKQAENERKQTERIKYNKCRQRINIRVSPDLFTLVEEACIAIGVSKQAMVTYCVLAQLDPTGAYCPDAARLPKILSL